MHKTVLVTVAALTVSPAFAEGDDCIENIAGQVVCGSDANAVRARMRVEAALARGEEPRKAVSQGRSVYGKFNQAAFVRGGYIFAAHGGGVSESASAPMASVGFWSPLSRSGNHRWSFESEVVYVRDSEDVVIVPPDTLTISGYALTGLFSLRWQYETGGFLSPYVSAGVGPTYARAKISDGIDEISDGVWAFGYSGRAGLEARVSQNVSMEAGYRYLGATNNGNLGLHTGEVGVNFKF